MSNRYTKTHVVAGVLAALVALVLLNVWLAMPAKAQRTAVIATCGTLTQATPALGSAGIIGLDQNGNVCVSASVTASVTGFAPAGTFATLTASGSSGSVALPAGAVVVFNNTGTTAVSCTLGIGSATAVASNNIIQASSWMAMTVGSNTFGACIDQTGSASNLVVLAGGSGLPTGAGGGGGSSGGAVTVADGADVAQGTTTDAACATDNGTCTEVALLKRTNQRLTTINTTLGTPLQAGGAVTNAGTFAAQLTGATNNINNISGTVSLPTGAATSANQTTWQSATAGAVPANAVYSGVNVGGNIVGVIGDPCQTVAKTYTPISITTVTTTRIVAPTSAKKTYVCYLLLTSAGADNVGIVEGTGGTCGSGTAGVIGGSTAANGPNFSANGGMSIGNGGFAVASTAGTNVDLCLITSAATPLAGIIAWVAQ